MSLEQKKGGQPEGLAPFSDGSDAHRVDTLEDSAERLLGQAPSGAPVRVYIDGFNLYHAIAALKQDKLKWLNFWKLSQSFLRQGETLEEVNLFTAVLTWNREKQQRHVNFLAACRAVGVTVHEANFKRTFKACEVSGRDCKFFEEKQTDVAIAVRLVTDALQGRFRRAILITADSDQIPTARFIAGVPGVELSLVFPPGRKDVARDLGNHIADKRELQAGRMLTCLLPRSVKSVAGKTVASRPALYDPAFTS